MAGIRAEINVGVNKRSLDRAAAEVNRVMGGLSKKGVNFNINDRSFTQPLGRITGAANEFTKSLEASNARVIAFGASVGIINGIQNAFTELVKETIRFEKTLGDVNVILNASNLNLERFGAGLFDVAKNTAQSFNVAAEAALEFSRQGLTMNEVLKRTNDALTLTRLTSLKATEAVAGLTAAVNAFSDVGLTTTQVIDKLAAVDVKFAVSSEDLIHALERTGAVAIDAGVNLNSLIGLVTALQQTTARGGAVIGNGLKTIFTRIQRPEAIKQLEELNLQVKTLSGTVLPADKILLNMARSFDTLSQAQQSNVVQFSAGIFQANVFRGILRDLAKEQSIHAQATDVAANAAGNAAIKNEKLNKTLAAMASQTGTAMRELAGIMGDLMFKPEIGSVLGTFQSAIEGLKNMLGGGEKQGSKFAKGLVRGIGNILTGPTAIAFGAVFIKLFINVAKFASQSLRDVLGVVSKKEKMKVMENSIVDALSRNKNLQEALSNLEGDRGAQEAFILKIIEAQTNAMRAQQQLARRLAKPLIKAGVKTDFSVSKGGGTQIDLDGDGIIDIMPQGARGVVPAAAKRKERREAAKGGYGAGAVSQMNIRGVGPVVYNKAETVKQFPGMTQAAIMPPQQSRAGKKYQQAFGGRHGFNPYASRGFIPNFQLEQSPNMGLQAGPNASFPQYIQKQLQGGAGMVTFKTNSSNLSGGAFGNIGQLLETLGISEIQTTIPVDSIQFPTTATGRMTPGARNILAGRDNKAIAQLGEESFLASSAGAGYRSTGADEQAVVDAIQEGQMSQEVKGGAVDLQNIFEKSIRRYSNKAFRRKLQTIAFANKDNADPVKRQAAKQLSEQTRRLKDEVVIRNLMTLAHMGEWTPQGLSQEETKDLMTRGGGALRKKMLQIGIQPGDLEKLESVGLGRGFVPNFEVQRNRTGVGKGANEISDEDFIAFGAQKIDGTYYAIDEKEDIRKILQASSTIGDKTRWRSGEGGVAITRKNLAMVHNMNRIAWMLSQPADHYQDLMGQADLRKLDGTTQTRPQPIEKFINEKSPDPSRTDFPFMAAQQLLVDNGLMSPQQIKDAKDAIANKSGSVVSREGNTLKGADFEKYIADTYGGTVQGGNPPIDFIPETGGLPSGPRRGVLGSSGGDMAEGTGVGDMLVDATTLQRGHGGPYMANKALSYFLQRGYLSDQNLISAVTALPPGGNILINDLVSPSRDIREVVLGTRDARVPFTNNRYPIDHILENLALGKQKRGTSWSKILTGMGGRAKGKTFSIAHGLDAVLPSIDDFDPKNPDYKAAHGFIPNFFDDEIDERSMEYVAAAMDPEGSLENASLMARAAYLKKYGNGGDDQKLKTLITDSFAAEIAAKKYLHHKNIPDKALRAEGINRKMPLSSIAGVGGISERDIDLVAGNLLKGYDRGQGGAGGFVPNFAKNPRKGNILGDWEGHLGDGSGEGNKYLMEKVSRGSPNWNRDISLSGPHRLESKIKKYREFRTGEEKEYEQKNLFPTNLLNDPKHPLRSPNQWVRSIKRGRIREGGGQHQGLDVWEVNQPRRSALDAIRDKAKHPGKKAAIKSLGYGSLDILDVDNHLSGTALQLDDDGKTWLYWGASQKGHLELIEQLQAEGVPMREASASLEGYDYGSSVEPPPTSVVQGFRQGGPGTRFGAGGFVPNFAEFSAGGKESVYSANVARRGKGLRGRDLRMFDRYYANPALAFARTERLNTVGSIIPDIQSDLLGKKNAHVNQMLARQVTKGIISKGEKERLMGLSMGSLLEIDTLVNQQARMLQTRNLGQAFDPATEKLHKEQAAYLAQTRYLDLEIQIAKKYLNNYGKNPPQNVMDKMGMMTSYGIPGERALQFSTFDSQYGEWGGLMLRNAGGGFIPNFGLFLPKASKVTSDPKRSTIKTVKALGEGDMPVGSARFSDLENMVTPKGAGRAIMMQGIENLGKIKGGGAMAFSSIVEYARENGIDYILSDGIREQHKWANLNGRGGTNWGKVLQQYPQLRYRLQPGLKTSVDAGFDWRIGKNDQGIETIGTSDEEYPSLASLKHFVETGIGDKHNIQMSSMSNLDTFVNASGAADGAAYGAGFIPNFIKNQDPRKNPRVIELIGQLGEITTLMARIKQGGHDDLLSDDERNIVVGKIKLIMDELESLGVKTPRSKPGLLGKPGAHDVNARGFVPSFAYSGRSGGGGLNKPLLGDEWARRERNVGVEEDDEPSPLPTRKQKAYIEKLNSGLKGKMVYISGETRGQTPEERAEYASRDMESARQRVVDARLVWDAQYGKAIKVLLSDTATGSVRLVDPSEILQNARGFVPNFGNPLRDAISREMGAGIPKSQIRVEQSPQLRGPANPMGLAVTNKRDEPSGVEQGIRRARVQGINPRLHGGRSRMAARGLVPNFAGIIGEDEEYIYFDDGTRKPQGGAPEPALSGGGGGGDLEGTDLIALQKQFKEVLEGIVEQLQMSKEEMEKAERGEGTTEQKDKFKRVKAGREVLKGIEGGDMGRTKAGSGQIVKSLFKELRSAKVAEQDQIVKLIRSLQDFEKEVDVATGAIEEENAGREDGVEKLFFFQSVISMLNGFLTELSQSTSQLGRTIAKVIQPMADTAAAFQQQKQLLAEAQRGMGVKKEEALGLGGLFGGESKEKKAQRKGAVKARELEIEGERKSAGKKTGKFGGSFSGMMGKASRGLLRFAPVVGQLYTGFTAVNSVLKQFTGKGIFDYLATGTKKAARRIEELGKVSEKVADAVGGLKKQELNRKNILELQNKGDEITYQESKQLHELQIGQIGLDEKVIQQQGEMIGLADSNIDVEQEAGKAFVALTASGMGAAKALKQIQAGLQSAKLVESIGKSVQDSINASADAFDWGFGMADREISDYGVTAEEDAAIRNLLKGQLGSVTRSMGGEDAGKLAAALEARKGQMITGQVDGKGGTFQAGVFQAALAESGIDPQVQAALLRVATDTLDAETDILPDMIEALKQSGIQEEKNLEITKDRTESLRAGRMALDKIKNDLVMEAKVNKNILELAKQRFSVRDAILSSENKLLSDLKAITKAQDVRLKLAQDLNKIEFDRNHKIATIDEEYRDKRAKQVEEALKAGMHSEKIQEAYYVDPDTGNQIDDGALRLADALNSWAEGAETVGNMGVSKSLKALSNNIKIQAAESTTALASTQVEAALIEELSKIKDEEVLNATLLALQDGEIITSSRKVQQTLKRLAREKIEDLKQNEKITHEDTILARNKSKEGHFGALSLAGAKIRAESYKKANKLATKMERLIEKQLGYMANMDEDIGQNRDNFRIALSSGNVIRMALRRQADELLKEEGLAAKKLGELGDEMVKTKINEASEGQLSIVVMDNLIAEEKMKQDVIAAKHAAELGGIYAQQVRYAKMRLTLEKAKVKAGTRDLVYDSAQLLEGENLADMAKEKVDNDLKSLNLQTIKLVEENHQLMMNKKISQAMTRAQYLQDESNRIKEAQNELNLHNMRNIKDIVREQTVDRGRELVGATDTALKAGAQWMLTESPKDAQAWADAVKTANESFSGGVSAMDTLRIKILDMHEAASNFKADLVSGAIDQARQGMVDLFQDIAKGEKEASEAWEDFGWGIANAIAERFIQHNIDKIISNLTYAFTGVSQETEYQKLVTSMEGLRTQLKEHQIQGATISETYQRAHTTLSRGIDHLPDDIHDGVSRGMKSGASDMRKAIKVGIRAARKDIKDESENQKSKIVELNNIIVQQLEKELKEINRTLKDGGSGISGALDGMINTLNTGTGDLRRAVNDYSATVQAAADRAKEKAHQDYLDTITPEVESVDRGPAGKDIISVDKIKQILESRKYLAGRGGVIEQEKEDISNIEGGLYRSIHNLTGAVRHRTIASYTLKPGQRPEIPRSYIKPSFDDVGDDYADSGLFDMGGNLNTPWQTSPESKHARYEKGVELSNFLMYMMSGKGKTHGPLDMKADYAKPVEGGSPFAKRIAEETPLTEIKAALEIFTKMANPETLAKAKRLASEGKWASAQKEPIKEAIDATKNKITAEADNLNKLVAEIDQLRASAKADADASRLGPEAREKLLKDATRQHVQAIKSGVGEVKSLEEYLASLEYQLKVANVGEENQAVADQLIKYRDTIATTIQNLKDAEKLRNLPANKNKYPWMYGSYAGKNNPVSIGGSGQLGYDTRRSDWKQRKRIFETEGGLSSFPFGAGGAGERGSGKKFDYYSEGWKEWRDRQVVTSKPSEDIGPHPLAVVPVPEGEEPKPVALKQGTYAAGSDKEWARAIRESIIAAREATQPALVASAHVAALGTNASDTAGDVWRLGEAAKIADGALRSIRTAASVSSVATTVPSSGANLNPFTNKPDKYSNFDMTDPGTASDVMFLREIEAGKTSDNFLGGKIQKFNKGGFVKGPAGKDNIPALLSSGEYVIPKGRYEEGGKAEEKGDLGKRLYAGAEGAAQGLVATLVAQEIADGMKDKSKDTPPTFDENKLNALSLSSDVSIKHGSPLLSGQYMAKDPVMQEYKSYLMEKAEYARQKMSEKYQKKMGTLGTVFQAMTSFAMAGVTEVLKGPINSLVAKGKDFVGSRWGKYSDDYKSLNMRESGVGYTDFKKAIKNPLNLKDPEVSSKLSQSGFMPISSGQGVAVTGSNDNWTFYKKGDQIVGGHFGVDSEGKAAGGLISAMLTAGEGIIPASIAKRIGYGNLNYMNSTGEMPTVEGPRGRDKVGPFGLTDGDFVIRKSATDKLLKNNPRMMRFALQNPEGFKRATQGYYEGGLVDRGGAGLFAATPANPEGMSQGAGGSRMGAVDTMGAMVGGETTNNININVSIDKSGAETTVEGGDGEGSYEKEKDLSQKIKSAVLEVIREEKRIGGELG